MLYFNKKAIFSLPFFYSYFFLTFFISAQHQKQVDSLQNELRKIKNDSLRCQIYYDIAQAYSYISNDSSLIYNHKALLIASKLKNKRMYANLYLQMIFDYMSLGKLAEARTASDSALKAYMELKDEVGMADVYDQTAYVYGIAGKFSKEYDYIFKAIELYEKNKDEHGKANAYSHLGATHIGNSEFIKALPYLQKALFVMNKNENKYGISMAAGNIGYLYLQQNKYDSAEVYIRTALYAGLDEQNWSSVVPALVDLGRVHCRKKNYKAAEDTLTFALRKAEERKMKYEINSVLSGLTTLYIATNDYSKAIATAERLIATAQEKNDDSYEADAYGNLAKIYEAIGQPALALRYLKRQQALEDTIWQAGNYEETAELNIKYATNQKEKENILLKLNLERQKREQYIWVGGLLLLLMLATGLGYIFWQRTNNLRSQKQLADSEKLIFEKENIILLQQQEQQEIRNKALQYEILTQQEINQLEKEKLQESIDGKSRALAALAIAMVQKNSILQDLKEKISENWTSKASFEAKIKGILSDIDNSMDMEEEWKTFKQHFEEVHPDFFVRLEKICPDLTPHEIRFCTYLKMNISAKDIAQMMNVTNRAIQMNRHRIKKKFGLEEEVDFTTFVRTI